MKKYFYFSTGQKIGILVLLFIIVALIIINESLPYFVKDKTFEDKAFITEVAQFKSSLKDEPNEHSFSEKQTDYKLFTFNPNTLDSAGFISLGIKPYIAKNILKYRAKGGTFRKASDFSKMYGISEDEFKKLLPYISIPTEEKPTHSFQKKADKTFVVEINSCDTTELKQLKGIGSSFAKRIIKYRHLLGGYAAKEQLKEVYGLTPEKYDEIEKFVRVDTSLIKKIAVNRVSLERLKSNRYLNAETAKAIYDQRKKLKKLSSKNDLEHLQDLPEETLQKILPYLSFE